MSGRSAAGGDGGDAAPKHTFLKKKPVIGGAGTPLLFPKDEAAFHSLDMPAPAAKARFEVKESLRLSKNQTSWNASVAVPSVPCERRAMTNFTFDPSTLRYNYRAERLPDAAPVERDVFDRITRFAPTVERFTRTEEMPAHPALSGKEWDVRTRASKADYDRALVAQTAVALEATARSRGRMLDSTGYTSPVRRQAEHMSQLRETRRQIAEVRVEEEAQKLAGRQVGSYTGGFHNSFCLMESQRARSAGRRVSSAAAGPSGGGAAAASAGLLGASGRSALASTGYSGAGSSRTAFGTGADGGASLGLTLGKPKRSLSTAAASKVLRRYTHTGTYAPVPAAFALRAEPVGPATDAPEREAGAEEVSGAAGAGPGSAVYVWSCCGSEGAQSRGCSLAVFHPDRPCFDSL